MGNKCEWIGTKAEGSKTEWKFNPCKAGYENQVELGKPYFGNDIKAGYSINYCPFCGSDIRKPEQPTHEEIMTKWWYVKDLRVWVKVIGYRSNTYIIMHTKYIQNSNYGPLNSKTKKWFIDKKSSTIPLEL